jgi:hypothetical protein
MLIIVYIIISISSVASNKCGDCIEEYWNCSLQLTDTNQSVKCFCMKRLQWCVSPNCLSLEEATTLTNDCERKKCTDCDVFGITSSQNDKFFWTAGVVIFWYLLCLFIYVVFGIACAKKRDYDILEMKEP